MNKKKTLTKDDYEKYLNGIYTPDEAWHIGCYMYKNNQGYIMKYGSVLRRRDPIAFEVGYNEWCTNN